MGGSAQLSGAITVLHIIHCLFTIEWAQRCKDMRAGQFGHRSTAPSQGMECLIGAISLPVCPTGIIHLFIHSGGVCSGARWQVLFTLRNQCEKTGPSSESRMNVYNATGEN